jgi:hypothetical protein
MPRLIEPSQAMEFFELTLAYQVSADRLFEQLPPQPRIGLPLSDPVYFLYYHAAELVLKALLLSDDALVEPKHGIRDLFTDCQTRQLLDIVDKHRELYNLMVFLGGLRENDVEDNGIGYRYASRNGFVPKLEDVREGVGELIAYIKPRLENWAKANRVAGQVTRLRYAIGKWTKQPE